MMARSRCGTCRLPWIQGLKHNFVLCNLPYKCLSKLSFAFLSILTYLVLRAPAGTLCIRTLIEHSGRVFRLQFDEFQIVSSRFYTLIKQEIRLLNYIDVPRFSRTLILFSSHDDTILIWDFLNLSPPER